MEQPPLESRPEKERSDLILYVVGTPIGNLSDLTDRSRDILSNVSHVFAEDTRRTRKLLNHLEASPVLESFHEHSDPERVKQILNTIRDAGPVALVTDAGIPGISDPGARLVKRAHEENIRVSPIPGPSSVTSALSVSGFDAQTFRFAGFPPSSSDVYREWIRRETFRDEPVVLFLAPHRTETFLSALDAVCPGRTVVAGREMTKQYEEILRGRPATLREQLGSEIQGEITLVLAPCSPESDGDSKQEKAYAEEEIAFLIDQMELSPSRAARIIANFFDEPRGDVYDRIIEFQD